MVRERGYRGGPDHFRHLVACHRPRPPAEAYLRLRSLPGEQAQVDWGHFGHLTIGRARRPLMAFVMVLSHSRGIFLRFFLDARMESFLRGHVAAFEAWSGCARVLLYDNLKSAVLERHGDAIRFHPTLIAFAAHYRYEPRPVAVALLWLTAVDGTKAGRPCLWPHPRQSILCLEMQHPLAARLVRHGVERHGQPLDGVVRCHRFR
jgi:hypothetical protein